MTRHAPARLRAAGVTDASSLTSSSHVCPGSRFHGNIFTPTEHAESLFLRCHSARCEPRTERKQADLLASECLDTRSPCSERLLVPRHLVLSPANTPAVTRSSSASDRAKLLLLGREPEEGVERKEKEGRRGLRLTAAGAAHKLRRGAEEEAPPYK